MDIAYQLLRNVIAYIIKLAHTMDKKELTQTEIRTIAPGHRGKKTNFDPNKVGR